MVTYLLCEVENSDNLFDISKKVNSLICFDGTSIIQWLHIPFDSDLPKSQVEKENNQL